MDKQRLTDDRIREIGKDIFGIDLALDGHLLKFARAIIAASASAQPPDDTKVICPACTHQFRAIPCDVQRLMLDAGFEPPFTTPPQSTADTVPVISVVEMKESHQITHWVRIEVGEREITPYKSQSKGRAEYEAATWRWLLLGEPKPDIMAFDTDLPTADTVRLADLAKRLRGGGWDLRAPQELADMVADWIDSIAEGRT